MELLLGFGVTSSSEASPAYIREAGAAEAQDNGQGVTGGPLSSRMIFPKRDGYEENEEDDEVAISDRSSSSIGLPDDSDDEEEDEASSKDARKGFGSLGSFATLEDSLPVKRGLSNHFSGMSKSFTNLAEALTTTTARDIEKTEHPFNKKRRILLWSKNMMLPTTMSMPLLQVSEEDVPRRDSDLLDDEEDRDRADGEKKLPTPRSVFKSYSCFALTDLREEDEEEEEE